MKVLIACEESQAICKRMRERGHEAYSCDIQECSGGHPEWHIKGDCLPIINGYCDFEAEDGAHHRITGKWDLLIAHPPCTYLSRAGTRWFNEDVYGEQAVERKRQRSLAYCFFMQFVQADCDRIAIENPVGFMTKAYRKPDQIIQPYMFGDPYRKATCLWLKGLPKLKETDVVEPKDDIVFSNGKKDQHWYFEALRLPEAERRKARSKTFDGIARAISEQWA